MSITLSGDQAEAIEDLIRSYESALDNILYPSYSAEELKKEMHSCQTAQRWLNTEVQDD